MASSPGRVCCSWRPGGVSKTKHMHRQTPAIYVAWFLGAAFLGGTIAVSAPVDSVRVIANPNVAVSLLAAEDLKSVFLKTKTSLVDGSYVEPVLRKGGTVHEAFIRQFIGKTDFALETYYRSLVFTGRGRMPKTFDSEAEVVAYVTKTRGAIGYVSGDAALAGVKTLVVK